MKDIRSFVKLFDINVPLYEEFDYYITQLSKTNKYRDIKLMINPYEEAESLIDDIYSYKMSKIDEIVEFIKKTRSYQEMLLDNMVPDLPTNKNFQYEEGKRYLSIDLVKANWNSLKSYDPPFLNELGETYFDFLSKFDLPEVFMYSKYFRQYIFGNLNPKKQIKVQRNMIQKVIDHIGNNLKLEGIKYDEVIYSFDKIDDILDYIGEYMNNDKYNFNIFDIKKVEDFRIDSHYDLSDKIIYCDMVGCSANKYFLNLKKYITFEKLDIRDLYFRSDKKLAIWYDERLNISL